LTWILASFDLLRVSGPWLIEYAGRRSAKAAYRSSTELSDGRLIEHIRVDIQLSALGKVAFERPALTVVIDPEARTVTADDTLVNISAPSEGILLRDVGRIVRDLVTFGVLSLAGRPAAAATARTPVA